MYESLKQHNVCYGSWSHFAYELLVPCHLSFRLIRPPLNNQTVNKQLPTTE